MYTSHFGFTRKPFKLENSADHYSNPNIDTACANILVGIRKRQGFILVTGEAGVGKTALLHRCMARADDICFVVLGGAHFDFSDILDHLCASLRLLVTRPDSSLEELCAGLGLSITRSDSSDLSVERRKELLLKAVATRARSNQSVALLVDDAQLASAETLLQLLELVEAPELQSQRLQVVLAALPDFAQTLDQTDLHRLRDSIGYRCQLEPLSEPETGQFIEHQLKAAGYTGQSLLSPAAIERIHFHCKGVPRTIGLLCDAVFLFASLQSEHAITPELVDTAAQTCFLADQPLLATRIESGQLGETATSDASTATVAESASLDLGLSDFEFSFESGEQAMKAKRRPVARVTPSVAFFPPVAPPSEAIATSGVAREADIPSVEPARPTADDGVVVAATAPPRSEILAFPSPKVAPRPDRPALDTASAWHGQAQPAVVGQVRMASIDPAPQAGPHLVAKRAEPRPQESPTEIGTPTPETRSRSASETTISEPLRSATHNDRGLTRFFGSTTEQEKPMSRLDQLNKILKNLQNESPGVEASALISEDGLMIASALPQDLDETRVAGMTATLLNLGTRAAVELRRGDVQEVIVRGDQGYSVMISAGRGALLLVLTNENSKLGLIFFDMREAIKAIRTIL